MGVLLFSEPLLIDDARVKGRDAAVGRKKRRFKITASVNRKTFVVPIDVNSGTLQIIVPVKRIRRVCFGGTRLIMHHDGPLRRMGETFDGIDLGERVAVRLKV